MSSPRRTTAIRLILIETRPSYRLSTSAVKLSEEHLMSFSRFLKYRGKRCGNIFFDDTAAQNTSLYSLLWIEYTRQYVKPSSLLTHARTTIFQEINRLDTLVTNMHSVIFLRLSHFTCFSYLFIFLSTPDIIYAYSQYVIIIRILYICIRFDSHIFYRFD